ncbi:hypothetical protein PP301_gp081 [Gordonia phage GMA2]|uniref:Uncharacterized protein n=1 Tax=Gordonia phage GMA2 TaxID=1647283 RepID=A0A0K0N7J4_9CAUD|nr:hypothetical protein PP301_gp081 [Gordonia phage GMA2]AKJ72641.1 hypothetical protein GMA2_103 [Gordonia phage GMA2]
MTEKVPADQIENIVGAKRHQTQHIGRLIGPEGDGNLYILHSQECRDEFEDLRDCPFSLVLDWYGVFTSAWDGKRDVPVVLDIFFPFGVIPWIEENRECDEHVNVVKQ